MADIPSEVPAKPKSSTVLTIAIIAAIAAVAFLIINSVRTSSRTAPGGTNDTSVMTNR